LHTNYQNKITIEDLTQTFHINRTTLSEKFRASTGMSIKDYLIKLRIKLSAVMLRDTLLPISEIMTRVGFNEAHHFSRMFKRHMDCLPSDYRKEFF
jgi:AraC family L-rhamnose operon regulatory protein RhaS